jgi:hypothetical protein
MPSYYAGGSSMATFELRGANFEYLPEDCIGIRANHNDQPLEQRYMMDDAHTYDIEVVSGSHIIARLRNASPTASAAYFSAILSADRNIVYWVNNTNPLP